MIDFPLDGLFSRVFGFLGFALLCGPLAWSLFVARAPRLLPGNGAFRFWGSVLLLGAAALAVLHLAWVFETGADLPYLWEVANQTHYGRRVIAHVAFSLATVAAAAILFRKDAIEFPLFFLALIVTTIASHSALGHAGADGEASVFFGAHTVHVAATVLWSGSLLFWLQLLARGAEGARRVATVKAFTTMAAPAFAIILISGGLNLFAVTDSPRQLLSPYGAVLAAKLGVILGIVLVLGGHHRRRIPSVTGRPDDAEAWGRFHGWIKFEALLVAVTILLAALMAQLPPP